MPQDQYCLFEDSKAYDERAIANLLGCKPAWVVEHIFREGCVYRKLGHRWVTTGQALNRWIIDTGQVHDRQVQSFEVEGA